MKLRWRSGGFALGMGALAFVIAAAAILAVQGFRFSAPSQCVSPVFSPLRALPWLLAAPLPWIALMLVERFARKNPLKPISVGEGPYRIGDVAESSEIHVPRIHFYIRVALTLFALVIGFEQTQTWSCALALPATCHPTVKRIALVPIDDVDKAQVEAVRKHFHDCYGLPIVVTPVLAIPLSAHDPKRDQYITEEIDKALPACPLKDPPCDQQLTIAVTDHDIYSDQQDYNWLFGSRQSDNRVAVVSTYRMDLSGGETDRLQKMIGKYIAIDYCVLPESSDPRNIRGPASGGTSGIDRKDESKW